MTSVEEANETNETNETNEMNDGQAGQAGQQQGTPLTEAELNAALNVMAQKPVLIKAVLARRAEEVAAHQTAMNLINEQLKRLGYKTTRAPRKSRFQTPVAQGTQAQAQASPAPVPTEL